MVYRPDPGLSLTASSKTGTTNERRHVKYENCSGKVPSRRMAWNWNPDRETTATRRKVDGGTCIPGRDWPYGRGGSEGVREKRRASAVRPAKPQKSAEDVVQYDGGWCGSGAGETKCVKCQFRFFPTTEMSVEGSGPKIGMNGGEFNFFFGQLSLFLSCLPPCFLA